MGNTRLTREQALDLLAKLAHDDGFRDRFAEKPATALLEIGLTADEIIRLDADCLSRRSVAGKDVFARAVESLDEDILAGSMSMRPPRLRIQASDESIARLPLQSSAAYASASDALRMDRVTSEGCMLPPTLRIG